VTVIDVTEATAPTIAVGAPGAVAAAAGVADADADGAPVPTALTADTRNRYEVPLANPVTVAEARVLVPSANVDHDAPALLENSTT
jgi:hypothetical protein